MDPMSMSGGGGTMSTPWTPMCGQSWMGAAVSFLVMWAVMMAVMMLPSLLPTLWRFQRSVRGTGALPAPLLAVMAGSGYFLVWTLLGVVVYPLGAATVAAITRYAALERAAPLVTGLIVLAAGVLQLTRWRARHLACCRHDCRDGAMCGRSSVAGTSRSSGAWGAWARGARLGLHCSQCCAGLTAVLLVTGVMDVPVMAAMTAGITLERLAPGGERIARVVGFAVIVAGVLLSARAIGLS